MAYFFLIAIIFLAITALAWARARLGVHDSLLYRETEDLMAVILRLRVMPPPRGARGHALEFNITFFHYQP